MQSDVSTQPTSGTAHTQIYTWQGHRCAYEVRQDTGSHQQPPLVLIHPIGVGLSRHFWDRFCQHWFQFGQRQPLYLPDLLGCGESDMPHIAYQPDDWAAQLQYFLQSVVQQPAIVVAQGALLPVAIALVQRQPDLVRGLILAGPPAWAVMTRERASWRQRLTWNLLDSPLGNAFYRYARRRQFLDSFSKRQLFDRAEDVDSAWLSMLKMGATNLASRHAVFSFLAGFWRQNYETAIANIQQPTLVVIGNTASSISQSGKSETPDQRMSDYLNHLPNGQGVQIPGRNVLPYEVTDRFIEAIVPFVNSLSSETYSATRTG